MKAMMIKSVMTASLVGVLATGCATTGYMGPDGQAGTSKTTKGAVIGGLVGAVAGVLTGDDAVERRQRALVGAGVGGLAGGAIGNYQDRQERALRDRLAGSGVQVVRNGDNITLNMPGNVTFDHDQSNVKAQFYGTLGEVASTLNEYNQTVIQVAGFTDSTGTDSYNQALSERRANAVASYLTSKGVASNRMVIKGLGESYPIASNDSEAGRAQNRRVEITIVPVTQ
ncbi:OmpA family protein [Aquilutibacter rugosus]|jgi:outer membrane protein OmpA-like peptidoglycan-associated protein|uniref:OmpA family protein n=1 Tax=Aquilutibacter rugosus TaxID=3115820 RepID=UPI002F3F9683